MLTFYVSGFRPFFILKPGSRLVFCKFVNMIGTVKNIKSSDSTAVVIQKINDKNMQKSCFLVRRVGR
jgi:hypothetical protein